MSAYPTYQPERPAGVTVLAILYFLQGFLAILAGAIFASFEVFGLFGFALVCGSVLIIIGIIDFIIGWGLWSLQSWARIVAIIFAVIGLLNFPIGTIISIIVLWYLFKPEIKAAFEGVPYYGPQPYGQPYQPGPHYQQPQYQQPPAQAPPQQAPAAPRFCRSCGASLPPGANNCPSCGTRVQ